MRRAFLLLLLVILYTTGNIAAAPVITGAACMKEYLPLIAGKRVAVVINQTSRVGNRLLADTLLKRGVRLTKIFVPEHGFRGTGDAGAHIANARDEATRLPIVSLYGDNKKPKPAQLADVDVVLYDLQDVGVRFFTYISTLQYLMEACAESGKRLIVLDRPDPNGYYVAGPILDTSLRSFVGMQPVPIVYGLTPGEYARMLVGERWFNGAARLRLDVIKCKGWSHNDPYELPVPPSPNLRTARAVTLYPSICLFEGTVISVGRGTDKPFEQWGHPALAGKMADSFRPAATVGATKPSFEGHMCYGRKAGDLQLRMSQTNMLTNLVEMYNAYPEKASFFNSFFEKLSGTRKLREQIIAGVSAEEIVAGWEPGINAYKKLRKKYLLYKDFE